MTPTGRLNIAEILLHFHSNLTLFIFNQQFCLNQLIMNIFLFSTSTLPSKKTNNGVINKLKLTSNKVNEYIFISRLLVSAPLSSRSIIPMSMPFQHFSSPDLSKKLTSFIDFPISSLFLVCDRTFGDIEPHMKRFVTHLNSVILKFKKIRSKATLYFSYVTYNIWICITAQQPKTLLYCLDFVRLHSYTAHHTCTTYFHATLFLYFHPMICNVVTFYLNTKQEIVSHPGILPYCCIKPQLNSKHFFCTSPFFNTALLLYEKPLLKSTVPRILLYSLLGPYLPIQHLKDRSLSKPLTLFAINERLPYVTPIFEYG